MSFRMYGGPFKVDNEPEYEPVLAVVVEFECGSVGDRHFNSPYKHGRRMGRFHRKKPISKACQGT